jgi:hypothetical protein
MSSYRTFVRIAAGAGVLGGAIAIAIVVALAVADEASSPTLQQDDGIRPSTSPSLEEPVIRTWLDELTRAPSGEPRLLSCMDRDGNGMLDGGDDPFFLGLSFTLSAEYACTNSAVRADYFEGEAPWDFACTDGTAPIYLVVIGGGGSDLLDASQGDSSGLLPVTDDLLERSASEGLPIALTLSAGAVVGAEMAQTSLEQLLALHLRSRLSALTCARVVLIGHSHGAVTVTSVTNALDQEFSRRMLGVIVDRSNILYDRPAENIPVQTRIINIFQTNEGWHGEALEQPNVTNLDFSSAMAPIAPADGGGGPAPVRHRSLDDAQEVQDAIVEGVMAWLTGR